jgi:hypothetical protein
MDEVDGIWDDCINVCRDILRGDPLFKLMEME